MSSDLRHRQALAGGLSILSATKSGRDKPTPPPQTPTHTGRWCHATVCSFEIEVPPAEAWWCPGAGEKILVALKLKYHRLKAGGVQELVRRLSVALKLKYHRLKPGGVSEI